MGIIIRTIQRMRFPLLVKLQFGFALVALLLGAGIFSTWLTFETLNRNLYSVNHALTAVAESQTLKNDVYDVRTSLNDMRYVVRDIAEGGSGYEMGGSMSSETGGSMYDLHQTRLQNDIQRTSTEADNLRQALQRLETPPASIQPYIPIVTLPVMNIKPMPGSNFAQMLTVDLPALARQIDDFQKKVNTLNISEKESRVLTIGDQITRYVAMLDDFNTQFDYLNDILHNLSNAAQAEADTSRTNAQNIIFAFGILGILFALGFGFVLSLSITRPIDRVRHELAELSNGDLSRRLAVSNRDQLGVLAQTFNQSVTKLGGALNQVQSQSLRINSASTEIAAAARQQANLANEQASAVAEATVTIEELSHTAQQIAEAASLVAGAAEQALTNTSEGQETVKESITGINIIKIRVQDIAAKILVLSERAQRVNKIIELISSIAQETHLLALNAAIESAGAGEQGRRFAEVAKKVKQLAERTRTALREVQGAMGEIKEATNASVMATEQGLKEAERGVMLAHRSGDANESIIQMVERTVQLASAISLATQQQRSASEQVVASMRQLALIIREGASGAQQSSELALALDQVALDLREVAGRFRLPQPEVSPDDTADILGLTAPPDSLEAGSADGGSGYVPNSYPALNGTSPTT